MSYASADDVAARLGGRPLDDNSKPSSSQVEGWLAEASAMIDGALRARGITVPITDATGKTILKARVVDYAEGLARQSYAQAGNGSDEDGIKSLDRFNAFLAKIESEAAVVAAMLGATSSSGAGPSRFRSNYGDTITCPPTFTRETKQ